MKETLQEAQRTSCKENATWRCFARFSPLCACGQSATWPFAEPTGMSSVPASGLGLFPA